MAGFMVGLTLVLGAVQDAPPSHQNIETSLHKVELADNNWCEQKIEFVYQPKSNLRASFACFNQCRGEKHLVHQDCNASCDRPCPNTHKSTVMAWKHNYSNDTTIENDFKKFGLGLKEGVMNSLGHKRVQKAVETNTYHYEWKHWNSNPCSQTMREVILDHYMVELTYTMYRNDPAPEGKTIVVKGPSRKITIAQVTIPRQDFVEKENKVDCRCSVVHEDEPDDDQEPGDGQSGGSDGGISIEEPDGSTHEITTEEEKEIGLKVECNSMTECVAIFDNPSFGDVTVNIEPGTVFECVDGSAQDEVCMDRLSVKLAPLSQATVPIAMEGGQSQTVKGRFGCLNINRKEPRKGIAYRYAGKSTSAIARLAAATAASRTKGVADQVRLWIATDQASLAQMSKVLIPAPSKATYLRCLYEVANLAGEDVAETKYDACMDPLFAFNASANPDVVPWFVQLWARKDPDRFARALTDNWAVLKAERFRPERDPADDQHAADLFRALAYSEQPALRRTAIDGLMKAVPEDRRGAVADCGGLDGVLLLLQSTEASEATAALAVAEAYRDKGSRAALLNLNPNLPDAAKARARKLYSELESQE